MEFLEQGRHAEVRQAQQGEEAPGFRVRERDLGLEHVEQEHAHRRDLHQSLAAGPHALLNAVCPRIHNGRARLRGEYHQELLVLVGEVLPALLVSSPAPHTGFTTFSLPAPRGIRRLLSL